jgi:hypothetical protein
MKLKKVLFLLAVTVLTTLFARTACAQVAQPARLYQQMNQAEKSAFVAEQARNIARQMAGREYEFTPTFETEIRKSVNFYARRIGNGGGDRLGSGDARLVFERGRKVAPILIAAFKARHVSPLIGLYIPLIESEYVNLETPNSTGSIGMFQFLPKTGQRFDLTPPELLDVKKAADAAALYIAEGLQRFKDDPMKEALAVLSYNRGEQKVASDLLVIDDQDKQCSICALTAIRGKLDRTFQDENVYYVPRFFAAAIIGENPQAFGLQMQPLSSYEK